jgi:hypothetical protein
MEERILTYRRFMDELLADGNEKVRQYTTADWEKLLNEHLIQVGFFQHERLVHLIVTITFAILEMLCICVTVADFNPFVAILAVLILVLLVPYVRHYYILENEVQKMYKQTDCILRRQRDDKNIGW